MAKATGRSDAFAKNSGKGDRPAADRRQDRLKLALRENLKRRKSQARRRGDLASDLAFQYRDASPYDDGVKKPGK